MELIKIRKLLITTTIFALIFIGFVNTAHSDLASGFRSEIKNYTTNSQVSSENRSTILLQEDHPSQVIDGLYYIHQEYHRPEGDRADEGSLQRTTPHTSETTYCDTFVIFHFNEPETYLDTYNIFNIYYHFWQRHESYTSENFIIGYSTTSTIDYLMNESISINTSLYDSYVDQYRLVHAFQMTNPDIAEFSGNDIFNFTIKSFGSFPWIRTNPNQYSFVILNLEDNVTLQTVDRDGDGLSDYDELYVYITNPFDPDTDNDGRTDYEEVVASTYGYENSDPNDYTDTTQYDCPPRLNIDAGPIGWFFYMGVTNQPIQFTGSAQGWFPPFLYVWDFGDDTPFATEQNPNHVYTQPGVYTVTLYVTDSGALTYIGSALTTAIITGCPDLMINDFFVEYTIEQSPIDKAKQVMQPKVNITVVINNTGTADISIPFQVAFYGLRGNQNDDNQFITIGSVEIPYLGIGESAEVTYTWQLQPDISSLLVVADSTYMIDESDETNNQFFIPIPDSIILHSILVQTAQVYTLLQQQYTTSSAEKIILVTYNAIASAAYSKPDEYLKTLKKIALCEQDVCSELSGQVPYAFLSRFQKMIQQLITTIDESIKNHAYEDIWSLWNDAVVGAKIQQEICEHLTKILV